MIRDLSETLSALLAPALPTADISFERPTDVFQPAQTTVNLFLYDVRENLELRNNEPVVRRVGTVAIKEPPPVRLDCAYLVTAWPVGGTDLPLQEHRLLSQSLRRLLRFPTIPPEFLRGSLIGQQPPLPTVTARPDGLANPAEFWTALGSRLRVALTLKATIGVTAFDPVSDHLVLMKRTGCRGDARRDRRNVHPDRRARSRARVGGARAGESRVGRERHGDAGRGRRLRALPSGRHRAADRFRRSDAHGACRHPRRERHDDPARARACRRRSFRPVRRCASPIWRRSRTISALTASRGWRRDRKSRSTQDGTTDSAIVRAVDQGRRGISFQQGLARTFSMDPGDPAVTVQYRRRRRRSRSAERRAAHDFPGERTVHVRDDSGRRRDDPRGRRRLPAGHGRRHPDSAGRQPEL